MPTERLNRRKRPYERRYNTIAKRAKHPFFITYEEFIEFTKINACHYCDEPIEWGPAFGEDYKSGSNLDRKDNNRPYELNNLVVACKRYNYGKNNFFSYEEWKALGQVIKAWREKDKTSTDTTMDKGALALLQKEIEAARVKENSSTFVGSGDFGITSFSPASYSLDPSTTLSEYQGCDCEDCRCKR